MEPIGPKKSNVIHIIYNEIISEIVTVFQNIITNLVVDGETGNRKIY